KLAPPFRQHEFDILFGEGISKVGDLLDLATDVGIIDKAGSWYSYQKERIGQGREQSKEFLRDNERMALDIEERVRLHFGLVPQVRQEPEAKPATEPDAKQATEAVATAEAHANGKVQGGGNGAIKRKGKGSQARA
ncbi:MAG: hypothetical protein V3T05_06840, partial [Myxococcota bacterium]